MTSEIGRRIEVRGAVKMKHKFFLTAILISCFIFAGELYASPPFPATISPRNDAPGKAFIFAVVGDSQPSGEMGKQSEVFKKIIEEINKSGAEFLVHLGDKIHGSKDVNIVRRQYAEYEEVIGKLKIPVHHVVGNHEISEVDEDEELHKKKFGPLYYSFKHKNCFFIFLDTESTGREGEVAGEQLSWLESELEKGRECRYIFIFLHRPLFSDLIQKKSHAQFASEEKRNALFSLFKKYKVSAVFAGHEHLYDSSMHDGLRQFISGGGGGPFHFAPAFHHYLTVEVTDKNATVQPIIVTAE